MQKKLQRERRHRRIRSKIIGTTLVPRLAVFKSNKYIYAQLIDDEEGKTLAHSSSDKQKATEVGRDIAKKAKMKNIEKVVFDRGGFSYNGNMKILANAAREEGLKF